MNKTLIGKYNPQYAPKGINSIGVGVHYEGIIDDYAPWDYNFLDILLDDGKIINIHVSYLEKCE